MFNLQDRTFPSTLVHSSKKVWLSSLQIFSSNIFTNQSVNRRYSLLVNALVHLLEELLFSADFS